MALPLVKSLVVKMCLELPPGHAGQTNQAQAEKQHRHRLGDLVKGDDVSDFEIGLSCVALREEEIEM